ncbi:MAG: urate hydroxylase PuuD [Burkholderiales bacterium]|nr:urate hydroxylase PuuD [Burkholderiales bacterium]
MDWQAGYDWLHLVLRWFHVMAAVSWIGSSLYFLYLGRLAARSEPDSVEAYGLSEPTARWLKREAALAWLSGVLLLVLLYFGAGVADLLQGLAAVALLAAGWFVYDRLWRARPAVAGPASVVLLILVVWGLSLAHGGRLLYVELGALLGTLMAGNVWYRIAPALAAQGGEAVWTLARERSAHNNYLVFPTVALMVSNHVPGVSASALGPAVLVLLIVAFVAARHGVAGRSARRWAFGGVLALLVAMIVMSGR